KAAVLVRVGEPLVIQDVPVPEIGPDEVLIETHACGVCRTDLHIQDGLAYVPSLPHIPGHEPAGAIVEYGRDVTGLRAGPRGGPQPLLAVAGPRAGQRVVPHLFVALADCPYTRTGQHAQAMHLRGILGVTMPGGFA